MEESDISIGSMDIKQLKVGFFFYVYIGAERLELSEG